jgi:hypothetical protein
MANNMNDKRYNSWKEYYLKKGEELTGLVHHLAITDLSSLDELPREYTRKPVTFKECVAQYSYRNFVLVPTGTNKVRCIRSCFIFRELGNLPKWWDQGDCLLLRQSTLTTPSNLLPSGGPLKPLKQEETKCGSLPWRNSWSATTRKRFGT